MRFEIERQRHGLPGCQALTDRTGQGIDGAALETITRDHGLARNAIIAQAQGDCLERGTSKAIPGDRAPARLNTAIGGRERHNFDALVSQACSPAAIRAQTRPAGSAQRQQCGIRLNRLRPVRGHEGERARLIPAGPVMPHMQDDTQGVQPGPPGPQEGRGLHRLREDPPGRAYECRLAQAFAPGAQRCRVMLDDHRTQPFARLPISTEETGQRFGMGEVQPTPPGHQEFAAWRRHAFKDLDRMTDRGEVFSRNQPGRAGTDNGDLFGGDG